MQINDKDLKKLLIKNLEIFIKKNKLFITELSVNSYYGTFSIISKLDKDSKQINDFNYVFNQWIEKNNKKSFSNFIFMNSENDYSFINFLLPNLNLEEQKYFLKNHLKGMNNYTLSKIYKKIINDKKNDLIEFFCTNAKSTDLNYFSMGDMESLLNTLHEITTSEKANELFNICIKKLNTRINRSELINAEFKKLIIKKHNDGIINAKDFEDFPIIKSYFDAKEENSVFYKPSDSEFTIMLDYNKIHHLLNKNNLSKDVKGWNNKHYSDWINNFLQEFTKYNKNIKKVFSSDMKITNTSSYKKIFVILKDNVASLENEEIKFKETISEFLKLLATELDSNNRNASERKEIIKKFLNMYKLKEDLNKKSENTKVKRMKI